MAEESQFLSQKIDLPAQPKPLPHVLAPILVFLLSEIVLGYCICVPAIYSREVTMAVFELNELNYSFFVSFFMLGACFGCLLYSSVESVLSRTQVLHIFNLVLAIGTLLLLNGTKRQSILGRLIQGVGLGGLCTVVPLVNTELSPVQYSGITGPLNQFFTITGILFTYLIHCFIPFKQIPSPLQLKVVYGGFALLVPAIQLVLLATFWSGKETPRYHVMNNNTELAKSVLRQFYDRGSDRILKELQLAQLKQAETGPDNGSGSKVRIFVSLLVQVAQQLTAINVLMLYVSQIFSFDLTLETYIGLVLSVIQLGACLSTSFISDRFGRKSIMVVGMIVIGICNLALSFSFSLGKESHFAVVLGVLGSVLHLGTFGMTAGPIVLQYVPEIVKGKWLGISGLVGWLSTFVVLLTYPSVEQALGRSTIFAGFGVLSLGCGCLLSVLMIETKGRNEAQICAEFDQKW